MKESFPIYQKELPMLLKSKLLQVLSSVVAIILLAGCGSTLDRISSQVYTEKDKQNKVAETNVGVYREDDHILLGAILGTTIQTSGELIASGVQSVSKSKSPSCDTKMYGETKEGFVYCLSEAEVAAIKKP